MPSSLRREAANNFYRIGVLTAGVYLLTAVFYLRGASAHSRTTRELFAWFVVLSLLFLFWKGYRIVAESAHLLRVSTLVYFAALFCLAAFLTVPFHSTDVFGYINRGWQQVHYGQNPYVSVLGDIEGWQHDPMLREHWIYNPNPYGFLFTLLARLLCRIGQGNWWLTLALFKAVNVLAYAGIACLVWCGAKRLSTQRRPLVALYCFLWNPLILMHHIANGHNDILTGGLIALSMYLAVVGAWLWVIPVLVAAMLLKYAPALLIPLALISVVKHKGWKTTALSCLIGALILVCVSAPYLQDWRLFKTEDIRFNATLIDNSLHSFLIHIFENAARLLPPLAPFHATANALIKTTLRVGFLIFFALQVYKLLRKPSLELFIRQATLVMFVLICLISSKFNAWYLGMLLPTALLLDERDWLRRLIVLLTCSQLLSLTFFKQAYILNFFAMILLPCVIIFRQRRGENEDAAGMSPQESKPV